MTTSHFSSTIHETMPINKHSLKIVFSNYKVLEFKYIWLRDNCYCSSCIDSDSQQKLIDTAELDINVAPESFWVNEHGQLELVWKENGGIHKSIYDPDWLCKYGRHLGTEVFPNERDQVKLPPLEVWDRVSIWKNMPEISHKDVMETTDGLHAWLEMIYKYGVAILRNCPLDKNEILKVADRIAYVKNTICGPTFDIIPEPVQSDPKHLAFTGCHLELHTDMNYREKSPGLQMLHCLKTSDPKETQKDVGEKSFFVDGFYVAKWLEDNHPASFHVLTSTPVTFAIKSHSMRYSQCIPVICVDKNGEVQEIHYNNRTLSPIQLPSHLVLPFYYAYKLIAQKMRESQSQLAFHMIPGDLVAFNNRRVLHGHTSFDPLELKRPLQGCYVDIDEVFTRYCSLIPAH
ncbi:gamma-butyrobetaine dioxygenase-like [Tachypleus tridentatus]|uniref:gamma-butyrobetaine dioxygenase-like n=1 Tax=Tachypleus tridentatus TaxID=6853 RepID=UPI003FD50EAA